jgi:N-acetylglucosamine kinase
LKAGEGPITLAAGSREEHGVVIVAGTGSMAWGRNRHGESAQVGGWGALLGDEGSAYDIAVAALRAACRASDGRGPDTALLPALLARFGYRDLREIVGPIYHGGLDRRAIAAACPLVFEVARSGDPLAQRILRRAGLELALGAVTCARRLNMLGDDFDLVASGGVFRGGDFVVPAVNRLLALRCPGARFSLTRYEPAVGAALLGLRSLGAVLDDDAYSRLDRSLSRL